MRTLPTIVEYESLSSILGPSLHFAKISDVLYIQEATVSTSFIQFHANLREKYGNQEEMQAIMFWLSAKFETYTLVINHIGYIDIFIKLCWFDLAKGEAGRQGPWASCLFSLWSLLMFNFSDFVKISNFLLKFQNSAK